MFSEGDANANLKWEREMNNTVYSPLGVLARVKPGLCLHFFTPNDGTKDPSEKVALRLL